MRQHTKLLSQREAQVILLLLRELPSKEIGYLLELSHKTVHTYKTSAMRKLGVRNDVALVKLSERTNLELKLAELLELMTCGQKYQVVNAEGPYCDLDSRCEMPAGTTLRAASEPARFIPHAA